MAANRRWALLLALVGTVSAVILCIETSGSRTASTQQDDGPRKIPAAEGWLRDVSREPSRVQFSRQGHEGEVKQAVEVLGRLPDEGVAAVGNYLANSLRRYEAEDIPRLMARAEETGTLEDYCDFLKTALFAERTRCSQELLKNGEYLLLGPNVDESMVETPPGYSRMLLTGGVLKLRTAATLLFLIDQGRFHRLKDMEEGLAQSRQAFTAEEVAKFNSQPLDDRRVAILSHLSATAAMRELGPQIGPERDARMAELASHLLPGFLQIDSEHFTVSL